MNEPTPLSDLVADDLLLDALGRRSECGHDPLVSVLGALAAHADRPLSSVSSRRRGSRKRIFTTFAVLAVGATGAGVAAAVTLPHAGAGHEPPENHRARPAVPAATATQAAPVLAGVADTGQGRWTVITNPDGSVQVVPLSAPDSANAGAAGSPTADAGATGSGSPSPAPTGSTRTKGGTGSTGSTGSPKGQVDKAARPAPSGDKTAAPGKQDPPPAQDDSGDAVQQQLVGPSSGTPSPTPRGTGGGSSPDSQAAQSLQPAARPSPAPDQTPGVVTVPEAASSGGQRRATDEGAPPEQAAIRPEAGAQGAGGAGSALESVSANPAPAVKVPFLPSAAPLPSAFLPYLPFPTGR